MADHNYQTLPVVAEYMASFLPNNAGSILEPTPGYGALVKPLLTKGTVFAPERYEDVAGQSFDWVVMNPPFTPMKEGYRYLSEVMEMSNNIVALLPWLVLINSSGRLKKIQDFGLREVVALPRKAFSGTRVQCCILFMQKGFSGQTIFKSFNW